MNVPVNCDIGEPDEAANERWWAEQLPAQEAREADTLALEARLAAMGPVEQLMADAVNRWAVREQVACMLEEDALDAERHPRPGKAGRERLERTRALAVRARIDALAVRMLIRYLSRQQISVTDGRPLHDDLRER